MTALTLKRALITLTAAAAGLLGMAATHAAPRPARPVACSPLAGTWFHDRKGIPVSVDARGELLVNMSAYRRPNARGRVLGPAQIEVTFPDDGTFTGTLDGQGQLTWNNGTVWQATQFAGTWQHDSAWGPTIRHVGNELKVGMGAYGRPDAMGTVTAPSHASVNFSDDTTLTATLVAPNCIQWSNGTTWTK